MAARLQGALRRATAAQATVPASGEARGERATEEKAADERDAEAEEAEFKKWWREDELGFTLYSFLVARCQNKQKKVADEHFLEPSHVLAALKLWALCTTGCLAKR